MKGVAEPPDLLRAETGRFATMFLFSQKFYFWMAVAAPLPFFLRQHDYEEN